MSLLRMALHEMYRNRVTTLLLIAAVALGTLLLPLSDSLLRVHAVHTDRILAEKDAEVKQRMHEMWDEYRRITLGLGFNILILPEGQSLADFYAEGRIIRDMPEEYAARLAQSDIITIQHVLPSLHHRMRWQPHGVDINVIGVRGQLPSMGGKPARTPLRQAVAKGKVVLGAELCRMAAVASGSTISLLGRRFTVDSCHAPRGDQDDITAWIDLATLQDMLGKQGRINAILALECRCEADSTLPNIAKIRRELEQVLPGTRVIEFMSQALTRAEARHQQVVLAREARAAEQQHRAALSAAYHRLAAWVVPLSALACMAIIALITWVNSRNRRREIALLRALGWTSARVLRLFLTKAFLVGIAGAILGTGLAALAAGLAARVAQSTVSADAALWAISAGGAVLLCVLAAWLPAYAAATADPAPVLQKE